mmetsp:Transcript_49487/g.119201  ORF Transcript_49487/g.119201 Transcript_49487/m.119201 type:complete len:225 (+) Transcript_49487:509-1183(+)
MRPRHPDDRIQGRPRPGRQPRAALGCGAHLRRHLLLRARVHAVRAGVHTLQDAAGCAAALLLHRRVGAARHRRLDRRCHRAELEEPRNRRGGGARRQWLRDRGAVPIAHAEQRGAQPGVVLRVRARGRRDHRPAAGRQGGAALRRLLRRLLLRGAPRAVLHASQARRHRHRAWRHVHLLRHLPRELDETMDARRTQRRTQAGNRCGGARGAGHTRGGGGGLWAG